MNTTTTNTFPLVDKPSMEKINKLHPKVRQEVMQIVQEINTLLSGRSKVRIAQGLRTFAEQDALFKQRPKVTNARGGQSIHNYGLAFDFALMYDKDGNGTYEVLSWDTIKDFDRDGKADWMEVVNAFKALGFTWGGDFKSISDSPHLEKNFGRTWKDFQLMHDARKFLPGTTYVNFNY